jgi:rhodanese-related sulfurtransferase
LPVSAVPWLQILLCFGVAFAMASVSWRCFAESPSHLIYAFAGPPPCTQEWGGGRCHFAKFIPGLSLIAVAMAGVSKMPVLAFLLLDGLGALLFVSASVALGVIFQNAITSVLSTLAEFGMLGNLAVVAALALYLLTKWWRRQLFIRQLRMNRITVAELRKLIEDGEELVILDVRPKEIRAQDGIIPGAIAAHPEDIDPIVRDYSRDLEIIVYCACPNEESAATAAKHLKQAGFRKIRPLLGGIDAWVDAGHPIERAPLAEKETRRAADAREEVV